MQKRQNPLIVILILLFSTGIFWFASKQAQASAGAQRANPAIKTNNAGQNGEDFMVTDKCEITCVLGSCKRTATYDGRYCKLVCSCGFLGLAPNCELICDFPKDYNPGKTMGSRTIEYLVTATPVQMEKQLEYIEKFKVEGNFNDAAVLQEIYDLFSKNNGSLTGAQANAYSILAKKLGK